MNETFVIYLVNSTQDSTVKVAEWLPLIVVAIGAYLSFFFTIESERRKHIYELKQVYFEALDTLWKSRHSSVQIMRLKKISQNGFEKEIEHIKQLPDTPRDEKAQLVEAERGKKYSEIDNEIKKTIEGLNTQLDNNAISMGLHYGRILIVANKNKKIIGLFEEMIEIIFGDRFSEEISSELYTEKATKFNEKIRELTSAINEDLINQSKWWKFWQKDETKKSETTKENESL